MSPRSFSNAVPVCCVDLALIGLFALVLGTTDASGASAQQTAREPGSRFAAVWRIRGEVSTTGVEPGRQRVLRAGDSVFVGELIRAESNAEAVLRTDEAGYIAVRPSAAFVVEAFSAEGRPSDRFSLRLVRGALRMVTGWIGHSNRAEHRVLTPTATIGIRGTDHEPYVMSADLAQTMRQNEGTYDKVNRGGTTMDAGGNRLDVDPGKVGFVRARPQYRTRGLLTVLLPTLLDSIPEFYIPGEFDAELDKLSPTVETDALRAMEERQRSGPVPAPEAPPSTTTPAPSSEAVTPPVTALAQDEAKQDAAPAAPVEGDCDPNAIARTWLGAFDTAVATRRVLDVIRLFAPGVNVRANVRQQDGTMATVEMGREELARSAVAALSGLTEYSQRRPSIEAAVVGASAGKCLRINVRSVAIEQGRQSGLAYRFEALEEYVLELRQERWLAIEATTTQR